MLPEKVGDVAEQVICDVLEVHVNAARSVSVVPNVSGVLSECVVVPVSKSTVLELPLSDDIELAVRL